MDSLTNLVEEMHVTGGIFLDAEFTAPWCVAARIGPEDCGGYVPEPRSVIAFHYVSSGRLLAQVNDDLAVTLTPGDIVMFPQNDSHCLGSQLDIAPVNADSLIRPGGNNGLAQIRYGGGGDLTRIICGYLGTARAQDPLLAMLPPMIKLKVAEGALGDWVESSFRLAAREMSAGTFQSTEMLTQLAELLFKETLRRFVAGLPSGHATRQQGVRDSRVASALVLMHGQLSQRWTAGTLAAEVGLSRSAFADRFTRMMGEPPMRYLARQRMQLASERLKNGGDSIARIASTVGYESEAAFNRAFKREFGVPPATWKKGSQGKQVKFD